MWESNSWRWGLQNWTFPKGVVCVSICGTAKLAGARRGVGKVFAVGNQHATALQVAQVVGIVGLLKLSEPAWKNVGTLEVGMIVVLKACFVGLDADEMVGVGMGDYRPDQMENKFGKAMVDMERGGSVAMNALVDVQNATNAV